jgi:broad specificity phosphatase PhoE
MKRLFLVRHATTSATRTATFPSDEPLDAAGRKAAARLALPACDSVVCSPSLRCRETVALAGLRDARVDAALSECDFGSWAGRTLAEVHAVDASEAGAWMTDPDACPHGGESLTVFAARVNAWLDAQAASDSRRTLAVTHGGVVRAAVTHALLAPLPAIWHVNVAPLSVTELHAWNGHWTVAKVNCAAAAWDHPRDATPEPN